MSRAVHAAAFKQACRRAREWYARKALAYHIADADPEDTTPAHPLAVVALALFILAGLAWAGFWLLH